jgi:hypothetical protein
MPGHLRTFVGHYLGFAPLVACGACDSGAGVGRRSAARWPRLVRAMVAVVLVLPYPTSIQRLRGTASEQWSVQRARLTEQMARTPGKHLLIVRDQASHFIHSEWAHKGADLENAKVVAARDRGVEENRALLAHYADRRGEPTVDARHRPAPNPAAPRVSLAF